MKISKVMNSFTSIDIGGNAWSVTQVSNPTEGGKSKKFKFDKLSNGTSELL
jgi:hypothetical protein